MAPTIFSTAADISGFLNFKGIQFNLNVNIDRILKTNKRLHQCHLIAVRLIFKLRYHKNIMQLKETIECTVVDKTEKSIIPFP